MELTVILPTLIGTVSALAGVGLGYVLQNRANKRERTLDAVFKALALARQYQWDLKDFGFALLHMGQETEVPEGENPDAVRQFNLDLKVKQFEDAQRRTLDTEKELRLIGAHLALFTDLHRSGGETVTGFDIIVDEMCGYITSELADAEDDAAVNDSLFRYGVILGLFEQEAVSYLRKHVDRSIRMPEHLGIGEPAEPSAASPPVEGEAKTAG